MTSDKDVLCFHLNLFDDVCEHGTCFLLVIYLAAVFVLMNSGICSGILSRYFAHFVLVFVLVRIHSFG